MMIPKRDYQGLGGRKFTVQFKGTWRKARDDVETTMNPATRRLIQVRPDDAKRTFEMFDTCSATTCRPESSYHRKRPQVYKGGRYSNCLLLVDAGSGRRPNSPAALTGRCRSARRVPPCTGHPPHAVGLKFFAGRPHPPCTHPAILQTVFVKNS